MAELQGAGTAGGPATFFVPITKVDTEQRMVFGYASTEARDQQGEIIRLAAIKAALPNYMKFANIREMHQPSAVGVAKEAQLDNKGLWLGAKVVDDRAWNKCKESVYKGFSVGGRVTSRDPNDRSIITGLELTEISLVDRPANPEAIYEVVKRAKNSPLQPSLVQGWLCGVAGHQHISKLEAYICVKEQATAAGAGDQPDTKESDMTTVLKSVAELEQDAEAVMAQLAAAVSGDAIGKEDHRGAAVEAILAAREREGTANGLGETFRKAISATGLARSRGDEEGATAQAKRGAKYFKKFADVCDIAIGYHRLYLENARKAAEGGHSLDLKEYADACAEQAARLRAESGEHQKLAQRGTDDEKGRHADIAARLLKAADAYEALAKEGISLTDKFKDEAAKPGSSVHGISDAIGQRTSDTTTGKKPEENASGQTMSSQSDTNPSGSGKNQRRPDGPGIGEQRTTSSGPDTASGSGKNPRTPEGSQAPFVEKMEHDLIVEEALAKVTSQTTTAELLGLCKVISGDVRASTETMNRAFGTAREVVTWLKRDFSDKERQALADKGHALPDGSFPISSEKDLENAVHAYGRAKDKPKAKAHIVARAKALGATDKLPADWSGSSKEETAKVDGTKCGKCGKMVDGSPKDCPHCGEPMAKAARDVAKGLGVIAGLVNVIQTLDQMCESSEIEQVMEGDDDDDTPDKIEAARDGLVQLLRDVVTRETAELLADKDAEGYIAGIPTPSIMLAASAEPWHLTLAKVLREGAVAKAAVGQPAVGLKAAALRLEKLGARHSKVDLAHIQKIHDHTVDLGAACGSGTAKVDGAAALKKFTDHLIPLARDAQEMRKRLGEKDTKIADLEKRLSVIENDPLPSRAASGAGGKGIIHKTQDDGTGRGSSGSFLDYIRELPPGQTRANAILRQAQVGANGWRSRP